MRVIGAVLFFVVVAFVAALMNFPLSLVTNIVDLKSKGVHYDRTFGTVWDGTLSDVQIAGESIGQLNFKLQPTSILKLSPKLTFEFAGSIGRGLGDVSIGMDRNVKLENVIANIQLNAFQHLDAQLRQTPSNLRISVSQVKISSSGQCLNASGQLDTDLLASVGRTWGWDGPEMRGDLSCQEKSYLISFSNGDGPDKITAQAIVDSDTEYDVVSRVETQNARLSSALLSYGFKVYDQQGVFEYSNSSDQFGQ